jgi:hypothetical protein
MKVGRVNELPEERLELLLRFIDDCERLKVLSQPEQPVIAAPEEQPTAVPEAPEQSDLLQNIPE